MNELQLFFW